MQVGQRARVLRLERPTEEDRSSYLEQEGLLVRRLNVAWAPDLGSLWQLRFADGRDVVFAESELGVITADGRIVEPDMDELRESWGDAPRRVSMPFKRFGQGVGTAPALLAFLIFCVAGVLLVWAGVSSDTVAITAAGGALILIGIAAVAVMVS